MENKLKRSWISTLESLRYDVTRRDPLQAHKEYGTNHVVDVTLDASGQIRMTITRQMGETKNVKRKSKSGREYQLFVEQNNVAIANYRLRDGDDLAQVLSEMEKEIARA
ncbi:MAG: hypothetical protein HZB51_26535 [Chloroflexi bacterium]|nr:hypothetical protein [Chloroflexota bacterium]